MSTDEAETYEKALGTHWLRVDGDSIFVTVREKLMAEDMRALLDLASHIKQQHKVVCFFFDGRQCTGIDSAARRVVPKFELETERIVRVAFGMSFALRVVVNMLIRAQKVLFNRDVRIHVFEHEKEARVFFEEERERLRAIHRAP